MTATKAPYALISLDDPGDRRRTAIRRELGIESFGVNAYHQATAGERVIGEHDELGPGANKHEELYLVVSGSCTFTIDGQTVEAPRGSALFVQDPASKRSAVANEDGTTVVVVGGRPGAAFEISAGEAMGDFYAKYEQKDYAGALAACLEAIETHPGNPHILYNIGCFESLLGNKEEALDALSDALPAWPPFKELAKEDSDLDALRDDPRFQELVA
jgi:tetratricopeptide (TPR) repeat protein